MKKSLAVVLAALMMLSTTTFLANESGNSADNSLTPGYKAEEVATPAEIQTKALETALKEVSDVDVETAEILAIYDIIGTPGNPVTVAVPDVNKGDIVVVLHWDYVAQVWESASVSNVVVEDGKVTATYAALSPVAFIKVTEAKAATPTLPPYNPNVWPWNEIIAREEAAKAAQNVATDATLPKTGAVVVLPFAAMACLAGAVVCGRKSK
ncbi:MAG: hypothetical protein IJP06_01345 [Agathobacter sp.]|nr:hypothetical protein [Agathobacter sp.]